MTRFLLVTLLALGSVAAAKPTYQMQSFVNVPQQGWRSAAYWCSAGREVLALTQPSSAPAPSAGHYTQPAQLIHFHGSQYTWQRYQLGPGDAGAGQLYEALTPTGQTVGTAPQWFVHASNIENVNDPAYRMTHINEFVLPSGTYRCRYAPQATFMGATAQRVVTMWARAGTWVYHSANTAQAGGVTLTGGQRSDVGGQEVYRWNKAGYTYTLTLGRPAASLSVRQGNTVVLREAFQAYSHSVELARP